MDWANPFKIGKLQGVYILGNRGNESFWLSNNYRKDLIMKTANAISLKRTKLATA